ncbi:hypothetical protein ACX4MT_09250 [Roseomonas mucosa]
MPRDNKKGLDVIRRSIGGLAPDILEEFLKSPRIQRLAADIQQRHEAEDRAAEIARAMAGKVGHA